MQIVKIHCIIIRSCFKQLFFVCCYLSLFISTYAQDATIKNIRELIATKLTISSVFVRELDEGGYFIHLDSMLAPDFGVVFPRVAGGVWVRHYNKALGANPKWWGAKGDGINDDLESITRATNYCIENNVILQFPSGIFRVTGQWIIGAKFLPDSELFKPAPWSAIPSYVQKEHSKTRAFNPLIIRGSTSTCIYGDFIAKELTPIIYYSIKGNGLPNRPSSHTYNHEISNIAVFGRGSFNGQKLVAPTSIDFANNQIGIYIIASDKIKVDNCDFIGLNHGLFINTSYWGSVSNCQFEYCQKGFFTVGYNANLIQNVFALYCKIGFEFNGDELSINSINGGHCETGLICKGRYMVINQMYFENTNKSAPNYFQLILGRNKSDAFYGKSNRSTGIIINACTLTANGRNAVLLDEDFEEVRIMGGNINGPIRLVNVKSKINLVNVVGSFKVFRPTEATPRL